MARYAFITFVLFFVAVVPRHRREAAGQSNDLLSSYQSDVAHGFKAAVAGGFEAVAASPTNDSSEATNSTSGVYRLPDGVTPVSYALRVDTDLDRLSYSGSVEIVIVSSVQPKQCRIVLNAKDVWVTGVRVTDVNTGDSLTVTDRQLVDGDEQLIVTVGGRCLIPKRYYAVTVDFQASLRNDMSGYYRSSYREGNVTKWLAVTKFEPTHARKAFPCFDEPALKAPFTVAIKRRSDQISLSNMPLLNSTKIQNTDMFWDHYKETPPISTYLVAFFVGEFYAMKTRNIGIYTHRLYVRQAEYIADEAPKLLKAMEEFTGVDYTLPKLDLLAIPDFAAGAMENWGLNTYREILLLLSENSKTKIKEFVTTVVQHELSHQWFGDLVTCAWWDYLWLNEGFATFFEYFATKMVEPDWRLEDVFVYEVHQLALSSDQSPMHAISGSVETPAQIRSMFDNISYSKAGAVLRMLQYAVTENNFKRALNLYLTKNKFRAATPDDLWNAFENALYDVGFDLGEKLTVTEFMRSWTEQAGYPLVEIVKKNDTFVITQKRFLVHGLNDSTDDDETEWIIGLTYTTQNRKDFNLVLPKIWLKENKTVLTDRDGNGWYIFNLQSIGFFRVNYEEENWNALIGQLHNDCKEIHVLNRAQLIDDAFNLAKANRLDYALVLKLSEYLINEDDPIPWYSAQNGFTYLMNRMRRCPNGFKKLKAYVGYLAGLIYSKTEDLVLNHNSTDHTVNTGWSAFSSWACKLDNEPCTKSALSYFQKWRRGENIPADIRDAAFCVGVKYGDLKVWKGVLNVYVQSESASDRQSALLALACSKDQIKLSKYLDFMFEGYNGPILPQDFRVIYRTLASTPQGIGALIEFLTTKLDRIVNEIINGEQVATSIYGLLASRVARDEEILKIDSLRKDPSVPERLRRKFDESYRSSVDDNLAWFDKHHSTIGEWSSATVLRLGLPENPGFHHSTGNSTDVDETWSTKTSSAVSQSLEVSALTWVLFTLAALCLFPAQRLQPLL
ncbi:aminopeptidase N-like [Myzus persicae]|uniref:aminopeptidase N-like n=1 Tax=Myzus persicae TaxID=13164 RepID=UPI000B932E44|nr:aminopeptidase N-like [Myzus persicae]